MKINEITEGFGQAMAASLARAVGANQAAGTIEKGKENPNLFTDTGQMNVQGPQSFFQNPTKMTKLNDALYRIAVQNKKMLSQNQIEQIIAKNMAQAWAQAPNKSSIIASIMKTLTSKGVTVQSSTPAQTAIPSTQTMRIGDDEIDPESPLGKQLAAKMAGK
jgi:hypothetical protein